MLNLISLRKILTGFNTSVIQIMASGPVFRGHYSNQFDRNDPQLPALAPIFRFHCSELLGIILYIKGFVFI
jgi:hypothetical protein